MSKDGLTLGDKDDKEKRREKKLKVGWVAGSVAQRCVAVCWPCKGVADRRAAPALARLPALNLPLPAPACTTRNRRSSRAWPSGGRRRWAAAAAWRPSRCPSACPPRPASSSPQRWAVGGGGWLPGWLGWPAGMDGRLGWLPGRLGWLAGGGGGRCPAACCLHARLLAGLSIHLQTRLRPLCPSPCPTVRLERDDGEDRSRPGVCVRRPAYCCPPGNRCSSQGRRHGQPTCCPPPLQMLPACPPACRRRWATASGPSTCGGSARWRSTLGTRSSGSSRRRCARCACCAALCCAVMRSLQQQRKRRRRAAPRPPPPR